MTPTDSYSPTSLPAPGKIIIHDYRSKDTPVVIPDSLKILQWNVERNYESEAIIKTIQDLDPDVILLQEVDIFVKRSGHRDHMKELCQSLKLLGGFVCEFHELDSPVRRLRDAGGGMHGNAILSKYDVDFRVLKHSKKAFDWEKHGSWLKEPRKGERYTLVGTIKAPKLPPILCYCVHLEVFTGIIDRINNFADVFEDAAVRIEEYPHQIISGDLNTMAHSIARLSRTYARDRYRWMSLGDTESNWFDRHVMAVFRNDQDEQYAYNLRLAAGGFPFSMLPVRIIKHLPLGLLTFVSGFEKETLKKARNPGFYDPWDPDEITLHNPRYFGLFKAKLDWTMVRCMEVKQKWIGNRDYSASDHAYLMVKVTPDSSDKMENLKETWKVRRQQWQLNKSAPKRRATIGLTILGLAIAFIVQFYFYLTQNRMLF